MQIELNSLLNNVFKSEDDFIEAFKYTMLTSYAKGIEDSDIFEKYSVLSKMVMTYAMSKWQATKSNIRKSNAKTLYYFSLEFLLGRMLTNNMMSMGIYDVVKKAFDKMGIDINEIEDVEADAGLGNGGLGRLAACFLDSLASLNYPGNGNCIRYRNGLFKQLIVDNKQVEVPDQWLKMGYPWEIRKPQHAVNVKFNGKVEISRNEFGDLKFKHVDAENVLAVPYDVPIIGANTTTTNTLRLWSAEPSEDLPKNRKFHDYLNDVEKICLNLYPEDYSEEGKLTRIKQEYFFVAAGLETIINEHYKVYKTLDNIGDKISIQLNDTHPALAIPEFLRILIDNYDYKWDDAWVLAKKVFSYTNHTVLQEALEKWPVEYIKKLLPRIYLIIEEIDRQFRNFLQAKGKDYNFIEANAIISQGHVRMAYLSIVGSHSVNGVASIHSEIIKRETFRGFNEIYPEKFNNKTNGITPRRWLLYSNPELTSLIEKYIGPDFKKDFTKIADLLKYVDDADLQKEFVEIKKQKKYQLANWLNKNYDITIDAESIFDCQAKRLHAYKRQLLNIMYVISLYFRIKEDKSFKMNKTTFIFGAKAAGTYYFAKDVISLINSVARVVNSDLEVNKYINVVFIPNYRVSAAEKLIPAADISEQISTAGKEASGTGNMKFMMNGALTLGTLDGANVEICDLVGEDNCVIFGLHENEVNDLKSKGYDPYKYYDSNPVIKKVIDSLTDGTWSNDLDDFVDIKDEFLSRKDEYMVLADFDSYSKAHDKMYEYYKDKNNWAKKCLINIAKSAYFSSDRTIKEYIEDIWHLDKIA